jgi:hypothetical protein
VGTGGEHLSKVHLKSREGTIRAAKKDGPLEKSLRSEGWTDSEPPPKEKKAKTYVNHNNFSGW